MLRHRSAFAHGYLPLAFAACLAALALPFLSDARALPVLGPVPILPVTLGAAVAGWILLGAIGDGPLARHAPSPPGRRAAAGLVLAGAALALPPVAIDLFLPFPRGINLPLPGALAFYPAIALVAETVFHLLPLAVLSRVLPQRAPAIWLVAPAALAEALFQVAFLSGGVLQGWLVLGNVGLIGAAQMWVFLRHGFAAMIGLRLAFYLFWHIAWGAVRLEVLF